MYCYKLNQDSDTPHEIITPDGIVVAAFLTLEDAEHWMAEENEALMEDDDEGDESWLDFEDSYSDYDTVNFDDLFNHDIDDD
jgi:hypothetical protein